MVEQVLAVNGQAQAFHRRFPSHVRIQVLRILDIAEIIVGIGELVAELIVHPRGDRARAEIQLVDHANAPSDWGNARQFQGKIGIIDDSIARDIEADLVIFRIDHANIGSE